MLISQKHTSMQEYTTALQTNTVCISLITPLSLAVAAYLLDFLSLLHTASTATLCLIYLQFCTRWRVCVHSAAQREADCVLPAEASPVKLVNKGPPQLLYIETLAKIAVEPPTSTHLYYLEPWGRCCHGFCRHGYKQLRICRGSGEGQRRREGWVLGGSLTSA